MKHFHIGSGAFGLGFSVSLSKATGNTVIVVNRKSNGLGGRCIASLMETGGQYTINHSDGYPSQHIVVDKCIELNGDGQSMGLASCLEPGDRVFFSTSVKMRNALLTYVGAFREIIEEVAAGRVKSPIYFLALENSFTSKEASDFLKREFPEIASALNTHFVFIDAVVDRICTVNPDQSNGVQIEAERYAKLYISNKGHKGETEVSVNHISRELLQPKPDDNVPDILKERTSRIVTCVDNIEDYRRMKLVVLNGSHTILALRAFNDKYTTINEFIRENRDWAEYVLEEMSAVASVDPDFKIIDPNFELECENFAKETLERFENSVDFVERVLHRFVDPWIGVFDELFVHETDGNPEAIDYLSEFFRNLQLKVVEPMVNFQATTGQTPRLGLELFHLVALLLTDARYISTSIARDKEKLNALMESSLVLSKK
ncbi:hypothetical protein KBY27_17400 [Ruegeria pomeroyi]|uniref:Mannitol dehydrogenase C-terminal domain-containing protein n=1 Tax=Ruegeria pomeroyi TaxID=89184 RepID=A0A9Q3ZNL1_9RHOB|nr:hypothetical protein [Ruegeria pomeroyi]MCE8539235.1 hypothetical protein [Ruegeria pomeroyi]